MKFLEFIKMKEMMGSVGSIVSCKDINNPNFQIQGALSNLRCGKKKDKKILTMKFNKNENVGSKLSDHATIKIKFPDADFWLIRKGTENKVGSPTKEFNAENIGIKVNSESILPDYLFYAIQYLHTKGYFRQLSRGTLALKNIRISDVENITLG